LATWERGVRRRRQPALDRFHQRQVLGNRRVEEMRAAETTGRFGTTEEFGTACAFLCGAQAGYITGQNLLLDGGSYPGTL
jgi:NAD(P)-dependent dehydrogenase (short-subunit alcohol dehydrogenase family)